MNSDGSPGESDLRPWVNWALFVVGSVYDLMVLLSLGSFFIPYYGGWTWQIRSWLYVVLGSLSFVGNFWLFLVLALVLIFGPGVGITIALRRRKSKGLAVGVMVLTIFCVLAAIYALFLFLLIAGCIASPEC